MKLYLLLALLLMGICFGAFSQREIEFIESIDNLLLDARYEEAIRLIDERVQQPTNLHATIVLNNRKAEAFIRMGRFEDAASLITSINEKVQLANDSFLQGITKTTYGFLQLNQGRHDLAQESFQQAIADIENAGRQQSLEHAQALAFLGLATMSAGKYAQAEEQLLVALSIRQKHLPESHELIAATYNDLGLVYSQQDKDKALDHYEKALTIYQSLHGEQHSKIAITSINMAIIYLDLKLYGDAVNNFESALRIWDNVYKGPHQTKAITLYNLGQTYLQMGDHKAASGYYTRALKMYEDSYGNKHPEVANVLNAIGNLYIVQNDFKKGLTTYQQALKANVPDFENDDITINPSIKDFYNGFTLLYSFLFKAEALESKYFLHSLKLGDLQQALVILHRCDSLIDKLRYQSTNENDKILLGSIANEVYAGGVRIAYEAGVNALSKSHFWDQAFYFAEKSKSAVLIEAISDANAKSYAGIPAPLLDEEKKLKSVLAQYAQKLAQRPTPEEERKLRETALNLNRTYELFIKRLESEFPAYYNLKFNRQAPSINQLQSLLDKETCILSYFIDEKNMRLYIFQITRNKSVIHEQRLPEDFDKTITGLRNSMYFNVADVYKRTARHLYKILIPRKLSTTKSIVILPTGRLSIVPFEALLSHDVDNGNTDFKDLPYLLKQHSIQYEFSAGLLLQKARSKKEYEHPSILLCAPVTFPEKDNLTDLPGTESEVKDISELFASHQLPYQIFTNDQANEKLLKENDLNQYTYLHLATHGIADEQDPELSRIFLQTSQMEDGNLFAGEIYNLKLNANLVTLSACQTGIGKISKGEGVIGLSRALVYAGARNIIVSYWSVADESTAELMKDFYTLLLKNPSNNFSYSLRLAKLRMIEKGSYAEPFFWAPFILIGY